MVSKRQKIRIIVILLIFIVSVVGLSYAYFTVNVEGNEDASSINVTTADLSLVYVDGNVISASDILPGWSMSKTFSVENTGSGVEYYDIQLKEVYNTIIENELVYTLTSDGPINFTTERIFPNNDASIATKISIASDVTHTYTLTVTFKSMEYAQNYNQRASLTAKIKIISPYKYSNNGLADLTLQERILLDNEVYADNVASKYVTTAGINYANTSDHNYLGQYTEIREVSFTSSSNRSLGTEFSMELDSGIFTLTGTTSTSQTYSPSSIGKYTCYNVNNTLCYRGDELYKILEVSGSTVTKVEVYKPFPNRSTWNGLGLYSTSTNTDTTCEAGDPTYVSSGVCKSVFFRGDVKNNYVSFAGTIWRIIRINEDGSIRMIKEIKDGNNVAFNSTRTHLRFVGYMYGEEATPYTNTTDSTIKNAIEQV